MLNPGEMKISFDKEAGKIRVESGDMGGVNHESADDFIRTLEKMIGGSVEKLKAEHGHTHAHSHEHGDHHHHH